MRRQINKRRLIICPRADKVRNKQREKRAFRHRQHDLKKYAEMACAVYERGFGIRPRKTFERSVVYQKVCSKPAGRNDPLSPYRIEQTERLLQANIGSERCGKRNVIDKYDDSEYRARKFEMPVFRCNVRASGNVQKRKERDAGAHEKRIGNQFEIAYSYDFSVSYHAHGNGLKCFCVIVEMKTEFRPPCRIIEKIVIGFE